MAVPARLVIEGPKSLAFGEPDYTNDRTGFNNNMASVGRVRASLEVSGLTVGRCYECEQVRGAISLTPLSTCPLSLFLSLFTLLLHRSLTLSLQVTCYGDSCNLSELFLANSRQSRKYTFTARTPTVSFQVSLSLSL